MYIASYHSSVEKRFFDLIFSSILIFCLLPVFILISIAIGVTSGLPITYIQRRTGFQKRPFNMIKFRTMRNDADNIKKSLLKYNEAPWPMFKMKDDPRFTPFGKFLSHTGLDEIPQLFNVIAGQMSITGPRPLPIEEAEKLPSSWNFRYKSRPGILSQWALTKDRYKSLEYWRGLEKREIIHGSLRADLSLIIRSIFFIIKVNFRFFTEK